MEQTLAVRMTDITKEYNLGKIGSGTLYRDIQSYIARLRGKENPNLKIGQRERLVDQSFMALNGINLTIRKGEALGIIGMNGAGKSTLLKLLSRVTGPTSGTIEINGRVSSMLEVGTGFHSEMTGRENVYLNGAILGMSKIEITEKLPQIIEFSEVGNFIDTPVKRYSSGMYVKLAFAVAAHLDADIMIMDEVLAVGDVAFQRKCLDRMRKAALEEGRTVLYVSHNMDTIRRLCSRCIVLHEGKIVYDGEPEDAMEFYTGVNSSASVHRIYREREIRGDRLKNFRFLECKVLEKDICEFKSGEQIHLAVRCKAFTKLENVSMHLEIHKGSMELGAIFPCQMMPDFEDGEERWLRLDIDTAEFSAGAYFANFAAHITTEYGANEYLSGAYPGFSFTIIDEQADRLHPVWKWGPVKFTRMHIKPYVVESEKAYEDIHKMNRQDDSEAYETMDIMRGDKQG